MMKNKFVIEKCRDCDNFDQIVNDVVKEHLLKGGITVCKSCHEKIDYRYRPYKNKMKGLKNEN